MLINDYVSAAAGRSPHSVPLFWWQGWSSAWYVASVYSLTNFSCHEPGTFILARCEAHGRRTPLLIGSAEAVSDDLFANHGDALLRAIKAGATEVHVHLAAETAEQRLLATEDIADGWQMTACSVPVHA
ncbi:hypothetical protein [Acuticoccus sp.]|uniref:hypothetical protein n=1 Tax=Acuticoccus sp. TaxID=1904378 RepID=UPI003B521A7A